MFTIKIVEGDSYRAFSVEAFEINQRTSDKVSIGLRPKIVCEEDSPKYVEWLDVTSGTIYIENAAGRTIDTIRLFGHDFDLPSRTSAPKTTITAVPFSPGDNRSRRVPKDFC